MNEGTCEIEEADERTVNEIKEKMLDEDLIIKVTDNFKTLSDPTRLKILYALYKKPLCVCDLAALLNMSQSAVSHQLRVLRDKNMVKFRKEGKMARYYLEDEHVMIFIKMGIEHAEEI